jgi:hypothetical protein
VAFGIRGIQRRSKVVQSRFGMSYASCGVVAFRRSISSFFVAVVIMTLFFVFEVIYKLYEHTASWTPVR